MANANPEHDQEDNPLQGYFDWQVNTLMLARDLTDPVAHDDEAAHRKRRQEVEDLVRTITLGVLPEKFKHDPSLDWSPELMMQITRATLREAARLADVAG